MGVDGEAPSLELSPDLAPGAVGLVRDDKTSVWTSIRWLLPTAGRLRLHSRAPIVCYRMNPME